MWMRNAPAINHLRGPVSPTTCSLSAIPPGALWSFLAPRTMTILTASLNLLLHRSRTHALLCTFFLLAMMVKSIVYGFLCFFSPARCFRTSSGVERNGSSWKGSSSVRPAKVGGGEGRSLEAERRRGWGFPFG